ncbi:MAG: hypothetical protein PHS59_01880 [Paludibacter sp.]|nr:hypothetical protein [Paludibacter sp.]
MKELLKYLGSILILVGVVILALYFFGVSQENAMLAAAGIVMIVGLITHIVINRYIN